MIAEQECIQAIDSVSLMYSDKIMTAILIT